MKPTSVIFLIFALILIVSGVGVLFLAQSMAESEDIALFSQSVDDNDNLIDTYDYTDDSIAHITLNLGNADVNVYGGSDKSYIELINFPKSTYDLSVSQKGINIDNTIGLLSIMRIKENGISFSGLRHYVNPQSYVDKPKTINIYVGSTEEIKAFNFIVDNGNVTIRDLSYSADYSVTINDGTLTMNKVNTSSTLNADIKKGSALFDTCMVNRGTIEIVKGSIYYKFNGLENQKLSASCGDGVITVNEISQGDEFTYEPLIGYMSFDMAVKSGDIAIEANAISVAPSVAD